MTLQAKGTTAQAETLALFVSDIHLQESMPATAQAFLQFLQQQACHAQSLYLLGDLFEYWAGDDDLDSTFHTRIVDALRAVSAAGTAIFWIAGNRDFLIGAQFASSIGASILEEPVVCSLAGQTLLLLHGDALCTDDTAYMAFRAQVRQSAWQQAFLAQPLVQRKAIIAGMREGSRAAQQEKSMEIMDVNQDSVGALFSSTPAQTMIHGHTHRPATHTYTLNGQAVARWVLPDWDCDGPLKRGGWIALHKDGSLHRMNVDEDADSASINNSAPNASANQTPS